jgi:hypothetical protein
VGRAFGGLRAVTDSGGGGVGIDKCTEDGRRLACSFVGRGGSVSCSWREYAMCGLMTFSFQWEEEEEVVVV